MDPVLLATARRLDPIRTALIETLDADPPAPGGVLVMGALAVVLLRGTVWQGHGLLALCLTVDALDLLRRRRAEVNAADRARAFGMRKASYLAMRRRLINAVLRLKRGPSWEPKTPASRQTEIVSVCTRGIRDGRAQDQLQAVPGIVTERGWGASPAMGSAIDPRSGTSRANPQSKEIIK